MNDKEIIHDQYCMGKCPKCDSDDILYYPPEIEGEALSYESECKDCGLQFYEQYYVKYENSYGIEFPEEPTT